MKKNIVFLLVLVIFVKTHSQNTLNFCKDNVYHYFPATASENFTGHFSLPGLSNINFHISQNAMTFGDIFQLADDTPEGKAAALRASKFNKLNMNLNIEALGFGFRVKNNYFTFSNRVRAEVYGYLPGDIANLLIKGYSDINDYGKKFNGSVDMQGTVYNETSLGFQRKINNIFSIGARVKFLIGHANFNTTASDINFYSEGESLFFHNNFAIRSSVPFNREVINNVNIKSLFKNYGAGLDLGFNVALPFGLEIRTSVLDLGWIRWKNGTYCLDVKHNPNYFGYKNGSIELQGIDFSGDDFFNINLPGFANFYDKDSTIYNGFWSFDGVDSDSLFNSAFIMKNGPEAYTTMTYPKLCLEASYNINIHKFAFLAKFDFARKHVYPLFTFGYSINVKKVMDVAVSYSIAKGYYKNLGFALSFHAGNVFHLYVATDNILAPIFATHSKKETLGSTDFYKWKHNLFNIQTGIYFTIPQSNKITNTSLMRTYSSAN